MNKSIADWLHYSIRFILLRGYGWKPGKRRVDGHYRQEWRDPVSGHWYGAAQALNILQQQILADYRPTGSTQPRYSLRC